MEDRAEIESWQDNQSASTSTPAGGVKGLWLVRIGQACILQKALILLDGLRHPGWKLTLHKPYTNQDMQGL